MISYEVDPSAKNVNFKIYRWDGSGGPIEGRGPNRQNRPRECGHGCRLPERPEFQARPSAAAEEKFLEQKVFLELFVKVRPNWRENELFLREYGY